MMSYNHTAMPCLRTVDEQYSMNLRASSMRS